MPRILGVGVGVVLLLASFSVSSTSAQCVGNEPPFFPHPTDCHYFYQCLDGNAILQECSGDLWWNPNLDQCDYQNTSFCTPGGSSTTVTTTTQTSSTGTPGPGYPMPCPGVDDPDNIIRYPHPTSCTLYYRCQNGNTALFTCVAGNQFNPVKRICQVANVAGCDTCPEVDVEGETVRLPHESVCRYYYICALGEPSLFQCANAAHEFSRYDRTCVTPDNAYCTLPGA